MDYSLLMAMAAAVLVAAAARQRNVSTPLTLMAVGLAAGLAPIVPDVDIPPDMVLFVILPPLLWSAGIEASYLNMRRNARSIGLLAVGLPLATTFVVGVVAYHVAPALTLAAALTLGAIVAPPDAVSATAVGRQVGLPRRIMTLLGGESLLNDATSLTAYKMGLSAAVGAVVSWGHALETFAVAAVGGVAVGAAAGAAIVAIRARLSDPLVESAVGLVAPFVVYAGAEQVGGSGVLAVVVAALFLGQRFTRAHYATRLQDRAVWRAVEFVLESLAFLLIGLALPTVVADLRGIAVETLAFASTAVFAAVLAVRVVWVCVFAYLPRLVSPRIRDRELAPTPGQVLVVAWAGMRGVVSLAAAFGVPATTLTGAPFPGRPQLVFLTFVVVVGTLLLHGLTLPWLIRILGVRSDDHRSDAIATATAHDKAARAALERLDELLAETEPSQVSEHAVETLRGWSARRRNAARERLRREETGDIADETSSQVFGRLRLEMLAAERAAFIAERDGGTIDDEVLRGILHGLDLEEASLNLG